MLGHRPFERLAARSRALSSSILGREVLLWHDGLDTSFNASFLDQQEDSYKLRSRLDGIHGNDWFLDIGGNLGFVAMHARMIMPEWVRILVVEPSPWNYVLLRLNLLENGAAQGVTVLRAAIGREPGVMRGLHYFAQSWSARVRGNRFAQGMARTTASSHGVGQAFNVSVVTLAAVARELGVERAVVKLDCEGCEWDVAHLLLCGRLGLEVLELAGELHFLCQHTHTWLPIHPSAVAACFPCACSAEELGRIWSLLCHSWSFEGACEHEQAQRALAQAADAPCGRRESERPKCISCTGPQ